jgi:EAL domain-containing protein (putative c-di-GMP-specific phosphodiesterase class I)
METANRGEIPLREIIDGQQVEIDFQPIVSVKKKAVIGVEALSRGRTPDGNRVSPTSLREQAKRDGLGLELDRLFRKKALEAFKSLPGREPDWLLFLNFDVSLVDQGVVGSGHIAQAVKDLDLSPDNIVLEITESDVRDTAALKSFINAYRAAGFLVALDDIGSGHSNLHRIAFTRPDILKITAALIQEIHREYYQQEIFKSLVNLSKKIGALVVAEGVGGQDEALAALEMGADMLQGFYFGQPVGGKDLSGPKIREQVEAAAEKFKSSFVERVNRAKSAHNQYDAALKEMVRELSNSQLTEVDARLTDFLGRYPFVECLYVLNQAGTQISDTVASAAKPRKKNSLFRPAERGADHSLKDYYYLVIDTFVAKYTTEPYVSLASGNLCITVSATFRDANNDAHILCLDVPVEVG